MSRLKNWTFRDFVKFLKAYGFDHGYTHGSHHFYNGKIKGEQRVVQVIFSKKEKQCQSNRTMDIGVRNSGIPKKYFEEWKQNKVVNKKIIY